MKVEKVFERTRFTSAVIASALEHLSALAEEEEKKAQAEFDSRQDKEAWEHFFFPGSQARYTTSQGNETWTFDNIDEWYTSYEGGATGAYISRSKGWHTISLSLHSDRSTVSVTARSSEHVHRLMRFFSQAEAECKLPDPPQMHPAMPVVVFVGHGRSADWRDIKDHLQDSHHYKIEAYEVGARAGHSIRDVLASMLQASSFALLVMTAEDETAAGDARARQNVIHEAGLFQGRLGFSRAIAVVENGVEVFSNLDGVQQIRYDKGNVKSTFGEILATLRREFGDRR